MSRLKALCVSTAILVVLIPYPVSSLQTNQRGRKSIKITVHGRPHPVTGFLDRVDYGIILNDVGQTRRGKMVVRGLNIGERRYRTSPRQELVPVAGGIHYPELLEGDVLPICGGICRTSELVFGRHVGSVSFTLLPAEEFPQERLLPLYASAIPLGGDFRRDNYRFEVLAIRAAPPGEAEATAHIRLTYKYEGFDKIPQSAPAFEEHELHQVVPGDTFTLGEQKYQVLTMVPPDPARQIIGWLTLEAVFDP